MKKSSIIGIGIVGILLVFFFMVASSYNSLVSKEEIVTLNELEIEFDKPVENSGEDNTILGFIIMVFFFLGVICGSYIKSIKKNKNNQKTYTIRYFILWAISTVCLSAINFDFIICMIINIITFLICRYGRASDLIYFVRKQDGSSKKRYSGGGGSSSGCGSTRRF